MRQSVQHLKEPHLLILSTSWVGETVGGLAAVIRSVEEEMSLYLC